MAKKKATNKEVTELNKKLDVAKELIDEKDNQLKDKDKEIEDLKQRIESDKGIPPDDNQKINDLEKQVKSLKQGNEKLAKELEQAKTGSSRTGPAGPVPDSTTASTDLIAACLCSPIITRQDKLFKAHLKPMIDRAIIMAEAIQDRMKNNDVDDFDV